jgi:glycosyltransferase involved in cell wall biosynthesis
LYDIRETTRDTGMNICIDAREFVKKRKTGISRYLETFLPILIERSEHKITLLVNDSAAVPENVLSHNIPCLTIPSSPTIIVDQVIIPRIAKKQKIDIFYSPYYKTPLFGKFKRIITVHDIMFLKLTSHNPIRKILSGFQLRLAADKTDLILVDSEYTKKDLILYHSGIESKIFVLYPTLDHNWLEPVGHDMISRIRTKYANNKPYFLYVGNFKSHKNVDLLVKAFCNLDTNNLLENHCLILAGGDEINLPRIEKLAGPALENGSVKIYRNIEDTELKVLYAGAKWFISASEYEGFGYPILEAMVSSCPVICLPLTSIPEITDNTQMFITKPDITEVIKAVRNAISITDNQRIQFIEKGLFTAKRFISSNPAEKILHYFNKLDEM